MPQLQFPILELVSEVRALQEIANRFIDESSLWVLNHFESDIRSILNSGRDNEVELQLAPLRTRVSRGEYEPVGRKGSKEIYATICGNWLVRALGDRSSKPKGRELRHLEFCGIASTRIELYEFGSNERIAMWRGELGDASSPGCYFHFQILGDLETPPFPKSVSIPRFPSVFITPLGIIEHILGELFQEEWQRCVLEDTDAVKAWRTLQLKRLRCLFEWQLQVLRGTITTPWVALKRAKPERNLFLNPR